MSTYPKVEAGLPSTRSSSVSATILTVCLDGLHNSGKTTQVSLLAEHLAELGIPVVIRRGHGMRSGIGAESGDPVSAWWQQNVQRMRSTGVYGPDSLKAAEEAANRLYREIYVTKYFYMPKMLAKLNKQVGVLLLDRGIVSRLFVKRRGNPEAGFESVRYFTDRTGQHGVIMPDVIFVLHASLDVLLQRNTKRGSAKASFNEEILIRYYSDFEQSLLRLPDEIKRIVVFVDSARSITEVSAAISSYTSVLIRQSGIDHGGVGSAAR